MLASEVFDVNFITAFNYAIKIQFLDDARANVLTRPLVVAFAGADSTLSYFEVNVRNKLPLAPATFDKA
jgi:hypothetical protein